MPTEIKTHFGAWEPNNTNLNFFSPTGNQPPFWTYLWTEETLYRNSNDQITYHTIEDVKFNDGGRRVTPSTVAEHQISTGNRCSISLPTAR